MEAVERHQEYSVFVDFASGVVGGCSGIIVGQPFDTVKVRLQTHSSFYKGPIDCARQTVCSVGPM
jgi:solute carrier family 25 carnitine/acylcarnitine transporter 20/29